MILFYAHNLVAFWLEFQQWCLATRGHCSHEVIPELNMVISMIATHSIRMSCLQLKFNNEGYDEDKWSLLKSGFGWDLFKDKTHTHTLPVS